MESENPNQIKSENPNQKGLVRTDKKGNTQTYKHMTNNEKMAENLMKKQKRSESNFENCQWVNLAIKFAYIGINYNGFEAAKKAELPFIEDMLFKMLQKRKFIKPIEGKDTQEICAYLSLEHNYKKCGRTDKGVSAAGNVINLLVRDDGHESHTYRSRMNSGLPRDIRVLDCQRVDKDFNTRLDCIQREYRYFFVKKHYNLSEMEKAGKKLIGEHDFRNFCKINLEAVTNHVRTIMDITIHKADFQHKDVDEKLKDYNNYFEMYYVKIKGNAF